MDDNAVTPKHYTELSPEPIVVIERWGLGFHLGNTLKYISRAGRKNPTTLIEDLEKARWYLDRAIDAVKQGTYNER